MNLSLLDDYRASIRLSPKDSMFVPKYLEVGLSLI